MSQSRDHDRQKDALTLGLKDYITDESIPSSLIPHYNFNTFATSEVSVLCKTVLIRLLYT